ncbi:MAG: ComEC/Rec2 family competence protein [Terriglobales bacterium]
MSSANQPSKPKPGWLGTPARQPLFYAALAFAAGILAGTRLSGPLLQWLAAFAVLALAAACFRSQEPFRGRAAAALALMAMAGLGAWCVRARDGHASLHDMSSFTDGREAVVTAWVTRDGIVRGEGPSARESVDVEVEEIRVGGDVASYVSTPVRVRLTVYERSAKRSVQEGEIPTLRSAQGGVPKSVFLYGQRLQFPVKLRRPRNFRNPGAWDYRGYLASQGIVALGSVAMEKIEVLPGVSGSVWGRVGSRARRSVLAQIHRLWPGEEAALFDAMLVGERSFIGRETRTQWQRTGIYHILVVSGLNVSILATVVFLLLRWVRAGETVATLITVGVAAGYACLADEGAPVIRAVLMMTMYLAARLLYRERNPLNAVAAAALVLLAADPRALFDASFQLTFVAVVAIAGIGVPLLERTSQPYRRALRHLDSVDYDMSLAPHLAQLRLDLRLIAGRMQRLIRPHRAVCAGEDARTTAGEDAGAASSSRARAPASDRRGDATATSVLTAAVRAAIDVFDLLLISFVMQIALALPMAFYFHRATVVGLPANTLAAPLTSMLMPAAAVALGFSYVWLPLAKLPALAAGWCLKGILWSVATLGGLRLADVRVATPALLPGLAAVAAFVLATLTIRRRWWVATAGLAALLTTALCLVLVKPDPQLRHGVLEITAIDTGEAESLLVVTPQGRTLLVDAAGSLGPWTSDFDFGEDVISPYLWSRGITRLDALAVTHPHADHAGGAQSVIANFRPRELWVGPMQQTPVMQRVFAQAAKDAVTVMHRVGGDQFQFGGAEVRVLAPKADLPSSPRHKNDDSLVMKISYGNTSALLEGDAEKQVERYLVREEPRADLLKVAHHGSKTSTTPELLRAVRPRYAVISSGAGNRFGHPRREVLERLAAARAITYRTDTLGATTFYLDGKTVQPFVPTEP